MDKIRVLFAINTDVVAVVVVVLVLVIIIVVVVVAVVVVLVVAVVVVVVVFECCCCNFLFCRIDNFERAILFHHMTNLSQTSNSV